MNKTPQKHFNKIFSLTSLAALPAWTATILLSTFLSISANATNPISGDFEGFSEFELCIMSADGNYDLAIDKENKLFISNQESCNQLVNETEKFQQCMEQARKDYQHNCDEAKHKHELDRQNCWK